VLVSATVKLLQILYKNIPGGSNCDLPEICGEQYSRICLKQAKREKVNRGIKSEKRLKWEPHKVVFNGTYLFVSPVVQVFFGKVVEFVEHGIGELRTSKCTLKSESHDDDGINLDWKHTHRKTHEQKPYSV
jgi:hypothetical protein